MAQTHGASCPEPAHKDGNGYGPDLDLASAGVEELRAIAARLGEHLRHLTDIGLALSGERDPRLVRLARALAMTGLRVVVPIFEHLKDYRFEPADRERLLEVAARFRAGTHAPLAVVAFSAGASLAQIGRAHV